MMNFAPTVDSAADDRTELVRLNQGEIYSLPYGIFNIQVQSGAAWITSRAKDYILQPGEPLLTPRQPQPVIISPVGRRPLRFEFRRL